MVEFFVFLAIATFLAVGWFWMSFVLAWWLGHVSDKPRYRRRNQ